ncbi:hypothetical protein L1987_59431 [Smallanthus sonchifolius]|uniref:Uncharacterized protein n=1 Tax=Smallanthus sonchifolius TaxID=185202 RepID=A0ACB9D5N8_9ASTR|nr:hypothetical protein L1987_59431 [Smallanthus sonchifolius]
MLVVLIEMDFFWLNVRTIAIKITCLVGTENQWMLDLNRRPLERGFKCLLLVSPCGYLKLACFDAFAIFVDDEKYVPEQQSLSKYG